jgi:hypothetical protein
MGELKSLSEHRDSPDRKRKPTSLPLPIGVAEVSTIPSAGAYSDVLDAKALLELEAALNNPVPDPEAQARFEHYMRTVECISQADYDNLCRPDEIQPVDPSGVE